MSDTMKEKLRQIINQQIKSDDLETANTLLADIVDEKMRARISSEFDEKVTEGVVMSDEVCLADWAKSNKDKVAKLKEICKTEIDSHGNRNAAIKAVQTELKKYCSDVSNTEAKEYAQSICDQCCK